MGIEQPKAPDKRPNPWAPVQYVSNTQAPRVPRGLEPPHGGNILLTQVNKVLDWGRSSSLWPVSFGLAGGLGGFFNRSLVFDRFGLPFGPPKNTADNN